MMCFPGMLVDACIKSGIKVPENPDEVEWDKNDYPHFTVFCNMQLDRPIQWGEHWNNAEVIAKISDEKIKTILFDELLGMGFQFQT